MIDLTGKTALVTGASRGIGRAIAQTLDEAGALVLLNSRRAEDLEPVAAEMRTEPGIYAADLEPAGAGGALAERVLADHDGIDILVNNAGIAMRRTPDQLTETEFDQVFNINVRGLLMLTLGFGDAFIARGGGSVINVSSVAGLAGPVGRVAYAGTKGAVDAMTRALAADWGRHGIRVNSVAPGLIVTDIWRNSLDTVDGLKETMENGIAMRRWGQSADIADVVLWLASDRSGYVTGETIAIDGGLARVRGGVAPEITQD